jgi:hypothetical protein
VEHVLVRRRWHELRRRQDRGVGERHGAADAGERDEGQGRHGDADADPADPEVAQVDVVIESGAAVDDLSICFCFSFGSSFNSPLALVLLKMKVNLLVWQIMNKMSLSFFFHKSNNSSTRSNVTQT